MAIYISSGTSTVSSGTLTNPIVTNTGRVNVLSGASVTIAIVYSGGQVHVSSGGYEAYGTYSSGGSLFLSRGALCSSLTMKGGKVTVLGARVFDGSISGGSMDVAGSGSNLGYISGITMYDSAWVYVSDGAVASNTVISSGVLRVSSGALAQSTTIIHNGTLQVWSGASASSTQVSSGGKLSVDPTAKATGNKVFASGWMTVSGTAVYNSIYGQMDVNSGGFVSSSIIYSGGVAFVTANCSAQMTTVNGRFVLSRGFAEITTVSSGGTMTVSSGGSADDVDVYAGRLNVLKGGTVSKTYHTSSYSVLGISGGTVRNATLEAGMAEIGGDGTTQGVLIGAALKEYYRIDVYSGGAVSNAVISSGYINVNNGGKIENTTVNDGSYNLIALSGGSANLTKLGNQAKLNVSSGGTATETTVSQGGSVMVFDRGTVIGGSILDGGVMYVSSGGTATGVTLKDAAWLSVQSDARASDTIVSGGHIHVEQDGKVVGATIGSNAVTGIVGELEIHDGGSAASATINAGGSLFVSNGGKATDIVENGGYVNYGDTATVTFASNTFSGAVGSATVHSRTTATDVTVNGYLRVYGGRTYNVTVVGALGMGVVEGGTATDTTVQSHSQLNVLEDGTANGVNVLAGGDVYVRTGGKLTGKLNIEAGALVSAYDGSTLDFDLTQTTAGADALVNDFSRIKTGAPLYTLTVGGTQADGTYKLAGNAAGFNKTISVTNGSESLGTLKVGQTASIGGASYTLNLGNDNVLSVTVGSVEPPTPSGAAKSDINANGISDVMFQYTGGFGQIGFWMDGTSEWKSTNATHPVDVWEVLGAYDMNANGKADSVLVGNTEISGIKGAFIGYYTDAEDFDSNWVNISYLTNSEGYVWKNKVGNLTGNEGMNSIVWHCTELGALGVWTDGTDSWVGLGAGYDSNWTLVGCGDFTGSGKDTVVMSYMGGAKYYTVAMDSTVVVNELASSDSGWEVRAIGDFAGDGKDDIVAFHKETGLVAMWGDGDSAGKWSQLGQLDVKDWFVVGAGDYDGNGKDDLLVRQYSTGMLGYYASGDMSAWTELGRGVDMSWTVIA